MRKIVIATLAASVLAAGVAQSFTTTASIPVTANVLSNCSASATGLLFGSYTPGSGALTGTSIINVKCTKSTTFTVTLDKGTGAGASLAGGRVMTGTGGTLVYNLFTGSSYTTVFGDGTTGGSGSVNGIGVGMATAVAVNVYGQLLDSATNQAAPPGSYTDTVAVTVTY